MDYSKYANLPDGTMIPERRAEPNIQQNILRVIAKMSTMEENISIKIDGVKENVKNLDERLSNRISHLETKLNDHFDGADEIDQQLAKHDECLDKAYTYVDKIDKQESKINILHSRLNTVDQKVKKIEDGPKDAIYSTVRDIGKWAFRILAVILGSAVLFAFFSSDFWDTIRDRLMGR